MHEPVPFLSRAVCALAETAPPQEVPPPHLQDLLERSSEELTGEQRSQLAELLTEYQDVFARSEFDFGDFKALVHEIDTGDAPLSRIKCGGPLLSSLGRRRPTLRRCWTRVLFSPLYRSGPPLRY